MTRNIKNGNFGWYEKEAMRKIEDLAFRKQAACKLIYIALCSMSAKNKNSNIIECYKFDIARFASVSEKTVQRHLPELEKLKIIKNNGQSRNFNGKYEKLTITLNGNNLTAGHLGDTSETDGRQMGDCKSDSIKEIKKVNKVNKTMSINKKKFLDFVLLEEKEHEKLLTEYGKEQTDLFIEKLNDYIGSKGKKYKSHYFTIRNWMRKEKNTPCSAHPPKKEISEGQRIYMEAQLVEFLEAVKRFWKISKDFNATDEKALEELEEQYGLKAKQFNINLYEYIHNNRAKDPQARRNQIQEGQEEL